MELYQAAARANGGEPDAGRRLLAWARAAGFTDVTPTAAPGASPTPDDRAYWGGMWADRILTSALADQLLDAEICPPSTSWNGSPRPGGPGPTDPDGWFTIIHGEILATA